MMKIALKSDLKSKTLCISKSYKPFKERATNSLDFKFYQKIFVILISFSTILIFPESPRELENICATHNSTKLCNVW